MAAVQEMKTEHRHGNNGEKAAVGHMMEHERASGRSGFKPYSDEELIAIADSRGFTDHSGLVVEPEEAARVFGKDVAANLKLNHHGNVVLYPQPTDDPNDPQNWSSGKKALMLGIISAAAFIPDFVSSCGIASLFPLAAEFDTTTSKINNLTSNWSIFMLGWGGLISIVLIKKLGRLPILFWSQLFGLGWTIGQAVAPNLSSFAAMRILAATFQTAPQVSGLFTITDMFPFHLQARMLNLWTLAFVASPFVGPSFLGFIVGQGITYRWTYGVACIFIGIVLFAIVFFMEETQYDRHLHPVPQRPTHGLRYRIETLLGLTGLKMAKYRPSWFTCAAEMFIIVLKPAVLLPLIYVLVVFGFGIGINVTNAVFVGSPRPVGYGLTPNQQAGSYFSPIVGCLIGEFIGRYMNDYVANRGIHRNHGVFEPEMRLWTLYFALPFYVGGFVLLGYCFEFKLNFAGAAIGWVMAEMAILMTTVCVYAYLNNVEPYLMGEVSALVNLFRVLGGFAVPFFQIPWAESAGPHVVFGVEAAIVAGLFLAIVPLLQWKGEAMRRAFPPRRPAKVVL